MGTCIWTWLCCSFLLANASEESLRFLVVGDVGGMPVLDVTAVQVAVAKTMIQRSAGVESILNLGDNFYYTGVMSDDDPRFEKTFERIYADTRVPWLTIAGNHDHYGNVSAQISYTKKSKLWYFPSLYYKQSYSKHNITVDFIMIDTIQLCGNIVDMDSGKMSDLVFDTIKNLFSSRKMTPKDPKKADSQFAWIEKQMQESTADYLFIAGHYPVYSVASYTTDCLVERLNPLLKKYHATAYLSGHDHSLQHMESSDGMTFIISGAGSRTEGKSGNIGKLKKLGVETIFHFPKSSLWNYISDLGRSDGGFLDLTISKNQSTVTFLDKMGKTRHVTKLLPRWRKKSGNDIYTEDVNEL